MSILYNPHPFDIIGFSVNRGQIIYEKCVKLYESGLSFAEVGLELGIPKSSVISHVKMYERSLKNPTEFRQRMTQRKKHRNTAVAPYGLVVIQGRLIEDPKEQEVIRKIHTLWNSGHGVSSIASRLNVLGIPTRENFKWHHGTISKIVKRTLTSPTEENDRRRR